MKLIKARDTLRWDKNEITNGNKIKITLCFLSKIDIGEITHHCGLILISKINELIKNSF